MSQETTIRKLAQLVNTPVEKLLEQLAEAGMPFTGPDQAVTSTEKVKLLGFLRRTHGKAEAPEAASDAPKKITLNRSRKQELTVGGGKSRSTVDVVVRKKVTVVRPDPSVIDPTDERAEILRKLEESRQRNLAEQKALAESDRLRAEGIIQAKRDAEEVALRKIEEAKQEAKAAEQPAAAKPEAAAPVAATTHGHLRLSSAPMAMAIPSRLPGATTAPLLRAARREARRHRLVGKRTVVPSALPARCI